MEKWIRWAVTGCLIPVVIVFVAYCKLFPIKDIHDVEK